MADDRGDGIRTEDLITLNRSTTVVRLFAGAVHEVNNALQVIGGTTEILRLSPDLEAPVVDGLKRIHARSPADPVASLPSTSSARARGWV